MPKVAVKSGTYLAFAAQATEGMGAATITKGVRLLSEDLSSDKENLTSQAFRRGYPGFNKYGPRWGAGPIGLETNFQGIEEWYAALMGEYTFAVSGTGGTHTFKYAETRPDEPVGITLEMVRDLDEANDAFNYVDQLPERLEVRLDPAGLLTETWTWIGKSAVGKTPTTKSGLTFPPDLGISSPDVSSMILFGSTDLCLKEGTLRFITPRDNQRRCYGQRDYSRAIALGSMQFEFEGMVEFSSVGTRSARDVYQHWRDELDNTTGPQPITIAFTGPEFASGENYSLLYNSPRTNILAGEPTAGEGEGVILMPLRGIATQVDSVNVPSIALTNALAVKQDTTS